MFKYLFPHSEFSFPHSPFLLPHSTYDPYRILGFEPLGPRHLPGAVDLDLNDVGFEFQTAQGVRYRLQIRNEHRINDDASAGFKAFGRRRDNRFQIPAVSADKYAIRSRQTGEAFGQNRLNDFQISDFESFAVIFDIFDSLRIFFDRKNFPLFNEQGCLYGYRAAAGPQIPQGMVRCES